MIVAAADPMLMAQRGAEPGAVTCWRRDIHFRCEGAKACRGTEQRNPVDGAEAAPIVPGTAFYGVAVNLCAGIRY